MILKIPTMGIAIEKPKAIQNKIKLQIKVSLINPIIKLSYEKNYQPAKALPVK